MKKYIPFVLIILLTPSLLFALQDLSPDAKQNNKQPLLAIAQPISMKGKSDAHIADEIEEVIKFDLNLAGCVRILTNTTKENGAGIGPGEFDMTLWRASGASLLIKTAFVLDGDDIMTEFRLYEVPTGKQLWSEVFTGKRKFMRKMAHDFVDATMRVITGEEGPFAGQIVFVSERTGNKEVYMMDCDGHNEREITANGSINLNPSFSPDGRKIIYTSYKKRNPDLYLRKIFTGKETPISTRPGLNVTGAWAPHGDRIALVMSKDCSPQLYLINIRGKELARLTKSDAIDISPSWSPEGTHIAFVSDREGSPQVYIMNAGGSDVRRVTKSGDYNVSPSWSPKGDRILYCRRDGKGPGFQIYVVNIDGTGDTRLTSEGSNEYPHWSPDGRFITFTSNRDGKKSVFVMRADGTLQIRLSRGRGGDSQPVWSPRP